MRSTPRLGIAFALTSCFWFALCQQNPPDPALYESFFVQVSQISDASGPVSLNGTPTTAIVGGTVSVTLRQITTKEAIGLTDQEAISLKEVASDCVASLHELDPTIDHLVFEARLERIRTDGTPAWLVQQLNDLQDQRTREVLDHVQRLKATLGDARFDMLDTWVRARKGAASFFPPLRLDNSTPIPVRKTEPSENKQ